MTLIAINAMLFQIDLACIKALETMCYILHLKKPFKFHRKYIRTTFVLSFYPRQTIMSTGKLSRKNVYNFFFKSNACDCIHRAKNKMALKLCESTIVSKLN